MGLAAPTIGIHTSAGDWEELLISVFWPICPTAQQAENHWCPKIQPTRRLRALWKTVKISSCITFIWLVVSNIFFIFHFICGMSSFPWTNIFLVSFPPTSYSFHLLCNQSSPCLRGNHTNVRAIRWKAFTSKNSNTFKGGFGCRVKLTYRMGPQFVS